VFGTAVASTPFSLAGGKAAFGGMRNGRNKSMFDDDEDEEDDGKQKVELREDSISLDQVCPFQLLMKDSAHCYPGPSNRNAKCLERHKGLSVLCFLLCHSHHSVVFAMIPLSYRFVDSGTSRSHVLGFVVSNMSNIIFAVDGILANARRKLLSS
jgi:hypothetical protein